MEDKEKEEKEENVFFYKERNEHKQSIYKRAFLPHIDMSFSEHIIPALEALKHCRQVRYGLNEKL